MSRPHLLSGQRGAVKKRETGRRDRSRPAVKERDEGLKQVPNGENAMDKRLAKIVSEISEKTGIQIDVYNIIGERLTSSEKRENYVYRSYAVSDFRQGILLDVMNRLTYFLINIASVTYIGVIPGADDVSRNYAYMVSTLIENAFGKTSDSLTRSDGLKAVLLRESSREQIEKLIHRHGVPGGPLFVLTLACERDKVGEVFNFLSQYSEIDRDAVILMDDNTIAYLCFYSDDNFDYQSSLDFADHLFNNIYQELGIQVQIGVGSQEKSLFEAGNSYEQSVSALKMGRQSNPRSHIHSYKEYIMVRMIEEIPDNVLQQYLDVLLDSSAKDILSDSDMMNTAEEFLNNSLNISETSRHLYMHRNTLMYRLDKIERCMGLNIRKFSDAVTFRIIMVLYHHLKS